MGNDSNDQVGHVNRVVEDKEEQVSNTQEGSSNEISDVDDPNGEEDDLLEEDESQEFALKDATRLARALSEKLAEGSVYIRVHDIQIKGNEKTKDSVIEAQLDEVRRVQTMQDLLQESVKANARLRAMGVFEKCTITVDAGPAELPGTANVNVDVEEVKRPFSGDMGIYSKPEVSSLCFSPSLTVFQNLQGNMGSCQKHSICGLYDYCQTKTWTVDGTVKWRNLLGQGETFDATGCYGWDTTSELSAGVNFPRFKGLHSALVSRATILTQDWHKYSSYRERLRGFTVGLIKEDSHDLSYNLTWRELEDPTHRASHSIRRQLGHHLVSSLKYQYAVDHRNSVVRPTQGFAFISSSQVAGIGPDDKLLRFARQEIEMRYAVPLGFLNAALNIGIAGGIILPWGPNFRSRSTPISDRFFMGGHNSLLGNMKGPSALLGFRTRGVGPSDPRQPPHGGQESQGTPEERPRMADTLGGDLAISSFVDLSFDLPTRVLREWGIHAHSFICAGNLVPLTGDVPVLSAITFLDSFRVSCGVGLVFPTKLFRLEVNYCYVLRQQAQDRAKRGFQVSLNSPQ